MCPFLMSSVQLRKDLLEEKTNAKTYIIHRAGYCKPVHDMIPILIQWVFPVTVHNTIQILNTIHFLKKKEKKDALKWGYYSEYLLQVKPCTAVVKVCVLMCSLGTNKHSE